MTIYNQITANKRRSLLILFLFIFLISGFFYLIGQYFDSPHFYFIFGFLFALFSSFFSYFFSDKIILFTVGARPAKKEKYFDYYTVTENLSIASGLPMPKLYVIDNPAPNAFATGRDPKHAVVCVTTGLLQLLDRSDLEGVIAHELSHIKNYDILLASIVATLVGTVSIVSDWILRGFAWRGREEKREESVLLYLFLIIGLILAPLIATLIQLAISRRREFLADASAVLLTRNKMGLISALQKISRSPFYFASVPSGMAHLFIVHPFSPSKKSFFTWIENLFSTHPPIEDRIKALQNL